MQYKYNNIKVEDFISIIKDEFKASKSKDDFYKFISDLDICGNNEEFEEVAKGTIDLITENSLDLVIFVDELVENWVPCDKEGKVIKYSKLLRNKK